MIPPPYAISQDRPQINLSVRGYVPALRVSDRQMLVGDHVYQGRDLALWCRFEAARNTPVNVVQALDWRVLHPLLKGEWQR